MIPAEGAFIFTLFLSKELLREKMSKVFQQKMTTSNITCLPGYQVICPKVGMSYKTMEPLKPGNP